MIGHRCNSHLLLYLIRSVPPCGRCARRGLSHMGRSLYRHGRFQVNSVQAPETNKPAGTGTALPPPEPLIARRRPDRHPSMTRLARICWVAALVPALLITAIPLLFAQSTQSPEFRETAVIPFFHTKRRAIEQFQTIYKRDLNGAHTLLLVRSGQWPVKRPSRTRGDGLLGLFVTKTDDPDQVWKLGFLDGYEDYYVEVEQADEKSMVLRIESEEGTVYRNQLLFDLTSRQILQQFDPASKAALPFLKQANPELVNFRTVYRKDLGDNHALLLVLAATSEMSLGDWRFRPPSDHFSGEDTFGRLGLFLMQDDEPDSAWELAVRGFNPAGSGKVERVDHRSIVLHFQGEKQATYKKKFIFDVPSKRLLKQWDVPLPVRNLLTFNGRLYAVVAHPEETAIVRLDEGNPLQVMGDERDSVLAGSERKRLSDRGGPLSIGSQGQFKVRRISNERDLFGIREVAGIEERIGDEIKFYDLPSSTFEELARYRPASARPEYEKYTYGAEVIGPYQIVENRFWFGQTFYGGEGSTGIGGFGYFDPEEKRYVVFSPPEIIRWSVSTLFVDKENIWLGLMYRGEWGNISGGLLKYHRSLGWTKKFDLGEKYGYQIIHQIKSERRRFATYLATNAGLFIVSGDRLTRYFFEPMLDGGVDIVKNPP